MTAFTVLIACDGDDKEIDRFTYVTQIPNRFEEGAHNIIFLGDGKKAVLLLRDNHWPIHEF